VPGDIVEVARMVLLIEEEVFLLLMEEETIFDAVTELLGLDNFEPFTLPVLV